MKQRILHSFRLRAVMLVAMLCAAVTGAWAEEVTDVLNQEWTGVTGTSYTAWSDKGLTSKAVYAGQSAGGNNSIQLRSNNNNSGVFTTTSGGKVKSITVEWNSNTANGRTLNVYGKNSAYSAASDLYNTSNQGTLLGTIVCGTSTSLTISGDYEYIGFRSASGAMYLTSVSIVWETGGGSGSSAVATTTTIDATGITNTDVYTSTAAGTLAATVTAGGNAVDGATVTWSGNNDNVATINSSTGAVTLVAAGSVTFTATYAGVAGTYQSSTDTYEMTVTSSAPYVQPTEFDIALNNTLFGTDYNGSASGITDNNPISGTQDNVTVTYAGSGNHYVNNSQIRFYPNNKLTFEAPSGYVIKKIVFTAASTTWAATISADEETYDADTKTWTGEATSVVFSGSGSSRCDMSKVTITLAAESTDPSISADNVNIAYDATGGNITFTLKNEVTGGLISASTTADWLTLGNETSSPISFTCSANGTTERTATVTLTYTYNTSETVTKDVTITQAAAPVIYTTIPALFDAATSTETDVRVTFGGWVVSAVHNNNAYLTDNQGHGLIIYANSHGFQVNDVLTGTVNCKLKLYNGSAEFTNLTTSTEGLTVTSGGTVTAQTIAISDLGGVNTGALLSFEGLTYNGTALVDGNSNTITPYTTLYSGTFESGKSYDVTGIYLQYNSTKEILPRSADDIEEVVSSEPSITVAQTTVNVTATDDNGTIGITYANLSIKDMNDFGIQYCDAQGNELSQGSEPTWIDVLVAEDNSDYVVSYTMDENTSTDARSAYFKVFAMGDADFVYSDLITVTQAGVVVDYATLPFIWAGGTSGELTSENGVTAEGLGSDYAQSNAPYRVKLDGTDDYIQVKTDSQPGQVYMTVKMLGGENTSSINVQKSADGNTFSDVEELTIAGSQNDVLTLSTTMPFDTDTRYVRLVFTKGSNVGMGPITITKPLQLNASGYATYASAQSLDFASTNDYTAWVVTAIEGETIRFAEVAEAPANTGLLLMGESGAAVTLTAKASATLGETNLLEAVTESKTIAAGEYFGLKGDTFVPVNAGTVPAGKALLPASALDSSVKAFTFVFDHTATGVRTVKTVSAEEAQEIFNLAGQRLSKTQRGINIVNGKKVVVK